MVNERRTSIGDRYTEQHSRICGAALFGCLQCTHQGGDEHVNHEHTKADSDELVFPFRAA